MMNEQQLIQGCKARERKAQKELYETYARKMMAVCLRYINDGETAADMLQDGFVKVFSAVDSYTGSGSFEGWIRRIIVNVCLEHLRKSDVLRGAVDLENTSELVSLGDSPIGNLTEKELLQLIANLPEGFRTVFNLFAIEGYSHREISHLLNISEGTSRSQYTRARQVLQRKINDLYTD